MCTCVLVVSARGNKGQSFTPINHRWGTKLILNSLTFMAQNTLLNIKYPVYYINLVEDFMGILTLSLIIWVHINIISNYHFK